MASGLLEDEPRAQATELAAIRSCANDPCVEHGHLDRAFRARPGGAANGSGRCMADRSDSCPDCGRLAASTALGDAPSVITRRRVERLDRRSTGFSPLSDLLSTIGEGRASSTKSAERHRIVALRVSDSSRNLQSHTPRPTMRQRAHRPSRQQVQPSPASS